MITGLALGVAVVLVALGLTIIFGLLDVINMAHGEFYAVGAYLALALGASGIGFWLLLLIVPLLMLPLGYIVERGLIQRVFNLPDRHVTTLLLTFGLGLVIEEVLKIVFGSNTQRPPTPIAGAIEIMGVLLPSYRLFLILIGFAIVAAVAIVINKTSLGAMVRAAAFDRNMAASLGVPVKRVFAVTFALGVALAGLAGVLLAPIYAIHPAMGNEIITPAFVVVVIGGLGSFWGVVVAALLVGLVKGVMVGIGYSAASTAAIYFLMLLVLVFRPRGLFGERITRFE